MKKLLLLFYLLTACFLGQSQTAERERGQLLVMFDNKIELRSNEKLNTFLRSIGVTLERSLSHGLNTWLITFDENIHIPDVVLERIKKHPLVIHAQYNHKVTLRETIPNDSSFSLQWALKNTGQSSGIPGADIMATSAWDITRSGVTVLGDTIVIAVVDNGCDLKHKDLNLWKNFNEIPNNSIDDDNNGYIDDYDGWSAYTNTGQVPPGDHGTHVTGIVAAITNNNTGIAGVSYNSKALPIAGSGSNEAQAVASYGYAFSLRKLFNETNGEKGAFIVATTSSFGIDGADPASFPLWSAIYDSLGSVGVINIAATANRTYDVDSVGDIPTSMTNESLIAVTNTTYTDVLNPGSAWGVKSVDIGAPGTSIYSTRPDNKYGYKTGTSMAAPMVSGAIALMYAASNEATLLDYRKNPALISSKFKRYLIATVDTLPTLLGKIVSGGRLNMYKATRMAANPPRLIAVPSVVNISLRPQTKDTVVIKVSTTSTEKNLLSVSVLIDNDWIKVDESSVVKMSGTEKELTFIFDANQMAEGTYISAISIEDFFLNKVIIPVQMNVDRSVDVDNISFKPVLNIFPNPFEETLDIEIFIPHSSPVKVQVLNSQGIVLNTLLNRNLTPGRHFIKWNGDNSLNQTVSSGVYFVTVFTNSGTTSIKAIKRN